MATIASGVLVLAGNFNLSDYLKSIEVTESQDVLDSTPLSTSGAREFVRGMSERSVKGEGFFHYNSSDSALSINTMFDTAISPTGNTIYTIAPSGYSAIADGATSGSPAVLCNTRESKHNAVNLEPGQILMTSFEAKASNYSTTNANFANGFVLWHGTQTSTANSNYFDNATTATGYLANLHVSSATLTSVVIKIQHSTDHSTWADLATFTTVTANTSEQKFSTSTSVNRYVRAIITSWSGTTAVVSVAIKLGYTG